MYNFCISLNVKHISNILVKRIYYKDMTHVSGYVVCNELKYEYFIVQILHLPVKTR